MSDADLIGGKRLLSASRLGATAPLSQTQRASARRGAEAHARRTAIEGPKRDADQCLRRFSWEGAGDDD